jgi:hypothetical protein
VAPSAPPEGDPSGGGFDDEDEATQVMDSPVAALGGRSGASSSAGDGAEEGWSVNLSDEDQRQMSTQELVAGWLSGEVTTDAFVWRDGMNDWLAVLDVPELEAEIRRSEARQQPAPPAQALAPSPPVIAAAPIQPKAAAPSPPKAVAAKARPATFDLFGPPRSMERDSQPKATAAPRHVEPASSENSVLFSLDALKAAAGKDAAKAADSRASEDLLTMGGLGASSPQGAPLIEVIPIRAHEPEPIFQAPATAPLMVPQPPTKKTPVWVWGAAAAVVLLVGFFGGRSLIASEAEAEAAIAAAKVDAARIAELEKAKRDAEEAAKKAEEEAAEAAELAKKAAEEAEKAAAESKSGTSAGGGSAAQQGGGSSSGSSSSGSSSSGSGSSGSSSGGSKDSKSANDKPSGGGAPFSVSAAKSALSSAAGAAKGCKTADGPTGSGKVQVTFAPSGRVTSARVVSGPFGGTSVGGCVARKFRSASVPAFSGSPTTVAKSFSIN